jgi:hypothetical protein
MRPNGSIVGGQIHLGSAFGGSDDGLRVPTKDHGLVGTPRESAPYARPQASAQNK